MKLPQTMIAMVLEKQGSPLVLKTLPLPEHPAGKVLVKVIACGICRTDLHIYDGELKHPKLPLILGHEIIGTVVRNANENSQLSKLKAGDIVGIPWLGYTCGECRYCLKGKENLCENAKFTGYTLDGGFAEYTSAYEKYCFPVSANYGNHSGAPLLCAGLIGYRSYRMLADDFKNLGIYGFGAAAHILIQIAIHQKKNVYAFTRAGDLSSQAFARKLGAVWAGDSTVPAPVKLDAAIIFAPVGSLVPKALKDVDKGGVVVCGGIHMSDIPSFPYEILWEERSVRSIANLTRKDAVEFLNLIREIPVKTETELFKLEHANEAIERLRSGKINGAAVLVMDLAGFKLYS